MWQAIDETSLKNSKGTSKGNVMNQMEFKEYYDHISLNIDIPANFLD